MANSGRAKGQISLKSKGARPNSSNPAIPSRHTGQTVGLKGAKVRGAPKLHLATDTHSSSHGQSKGTTKSNLGSPRSVSTVGLKGAGNGNSKTGTTRTNLSSPSPRAVKSQGLKSVSKKAPMLSLQSSGTPGKGSAGKGIPFKGNARKVTSSVPGASVIPAVIRRAASRGPANGSSKPSFTSKVVKITSK